MSYIYDHGGDVYSQQSKLIDFSININPLGLPPGVRKAAEEAISACESYPDYSCRSLREAISQRYDVNFDNIICGNGASDLIYRLFSALKPELTLLTAPSFSEYAKGVYVCGGRIKWYRLREDEGFEITERILDDLSPDVRLVFLCNPNNPTGRLISRELLNKIAEKCAAQETYFALDECFIELSEGHNLSLKDLIKDKPNLFILRAFTKDYAMPGLRLGYGFCGNKELLSKMQSLGQPWTVSTPAQVAGIAACNEATFMEESREHIRKERNFLLEGLKARGLEAVSSDTNFILFKAPGINDLKERLLKHGILIRSCLSFYGLGEDYYRIAVKAHEDNIRLICALEHEIKTMKGHH